MHRPKRMCDLPPELQTYVLTGTPFPTSYQSAFSKVEVLLAKQLRKSYFRNMANVEPGSQYEHSDFWQLMQFEVWNHFRTRLLGSILTDWNRFIDSSPDSIRNLWEPHYNKRAARIQVASKARRTRLIAEARRSFLRDIYTDPRRLGVMESFVLGKIIFGMPPGHNYKQKDS